MATKTGGGFKQQCPSCEAMIPIRDASLAGRKIDCPKCKYRFVVEVPRGGDEDDSDDLPAKKSDGKKKGGSDAVTAKRPGNGKAGVPPVKTKSKRRQDEEDEDEDQPKAKKAAGPDSKKMALGLGIAVFAILLLAVAGYLLFHKSPPPKPAAPAPVVQAAAAPPPRVVVPTGPVLKPVADITNLLPNDTQLVINLQVAELLRTQIGRAAIETPGAFNSDAIKAKFGFSEKDIDRILVGGNYKSDWLFLVVNLNKPVVMNQVAAALGLVDAPDSTKEFPYFVTPYSWMEGTSSLLRYDQPSGKKKTSQPRPLAVYLAGPTTLIMADLLPMKGFLADKAHPFLQTNPEQMKKEREAEEERKKQVAAATPARPRVRRAGAEDQRNIAVVIPLDEQISPHYLTLAPRLKRMMDLQETKQPLLFSMTDDMLEDKNGAFQRQVERLGLRPVMSVLGFCVQNTKEGLNFFVGMECPSDKSAITFRADVRRNIEVPLRYLAALLGLKSITFEDVLGASGDSLVVGGPRMPGPTSGRRRGVEGDEDQIDDPEARARAEAERRRKEDAEAASQVLEQLSKQLGPFAKLAAEIPDRGSAKVKLGRTGGLVLIEITTELEQVAYQDMPSLFGPVWIMAKGQMERALEKPRYHELADSTQRYLTAHNHLIPRGAHERPSSPARGNRPFPPDQRVSWMAELLPFLGYDTVYSQIDFQKSWQDGANFNASISLIAPFMDGRNPAAPARVSYPDVHVPFYLGAEVPRAATHFVGIAGIGADAASLPLGDTPDLVKRLGVFGYDRQIRLEDITDGPGNTIMIAEAAPPFYGPWIAGGGSTIRGVPETNSVRPFVSSEFGGKRGSMVLMADGSVRFIPENISDQVFKALCTIKGKEWIDVNREAAKVPLPAKVEMTAQTTIGIPHPTRRFGSDTDGDKQKPGSSAEWQEFVSQAGRFSVLLPPGKVDERKVPLTLPTGPMEMAMTSVQSDGQNYGVVCMDFPSLPPGGPDAVLDQMVKLFTATAGTTADHQHLVLDGNPGREVVMVQPGDGQALRLRVYVVGQRLYQLAVTGPNKDAVTSGGGPKFFDSFKLR